MTKGVLHILSDKILSSAEYVEHIVKIFLNDITEQNYNNMIAILNSKKTEYTANGNSFRILVSMSVGTVAYDSSKNNNTFPNFQKELIGDNHNTRPEIILSILDGSRLGEYIRKSTTTKEVLQNRASRLQTSSCVFLGVIRFSIKFDELKSGSGEPGLF